MSEYQCLLPPAPPKPSFANRIKIKLECKIAIHTLPCFAYILLTCSLFCLGTDNELKSQFYQVTNLKESLFHDLSEKQAKEFKLRMECDLILDQIELIRSRMPNQGAEEGTDPEMKRLRKYQENTNGFMYESDDEKANAANRYEEDVEEEQEEEEEEEDEDEDEGHQHEEEEGEDGWNNGQKENQNGHAEADSEEEDEDAEEDDEDEDKQIRSGGGGGGGWGRTSRTSRIMRPAITPPSHNPTSSIIIRTLIPPPLISPPILILILLKQNLTPIAPSACRPAWRVTLDLLKGWGSLQHCAATVGLLGPVAGALKKNNKYS
ncbi:hypothetical protein VP01_1830g1 [Puccinia sorghi]|uniref:Uncharacterized protein n=1 Tax=Puccinia sorghi TaxID=27349 RepID=A0A0L6VDZ1_9BASI|nr:hypothetical protein VP01_1830g1 [Puccinia sorghi]